MRRAEEWTALDPAFCVDSDCTSEELLAFIRKVQADALRYATNLSGDNKNRFLIALADQLDPQPAHPTP